MVWWALWSWSGRYRCGGGALWTRPPWLHHPDVHRGLLARAVRADGALVHVQQAHAERSAALNDEPEHVRVQQAFGAHAVRLDEQLAGRESTALRAAPLLHRHQHVLQRVAVGLLARVHADGAHREAEPARPAHELHHAALPGRRSGRPAVRLASRHFRAAAALVATRTGTRGGFTGGPAADAATDAAVGVVASISSPLAPLPNSGDCFMGRARALSRITGALGTFALCDRRRLHA